MTHNPATDFLCPECDGKCEVVCHCCGIESDCQHCNGSGLNPDLVDIRRYEDACDQLPAPKWDLIDDERFLGRKNADGQTVLIADFLKTPAEGA